MHGTLNDVGLLLFNIKGYPAAGPQRTTTDSSAVRSLGSAS